MNLFAFLLTFFFRGGAVESVILQQTLEKAQARLVAKRALGPHRLCGVFFRTHEHKQSGPVGGDAPEGQWSRGPRGAQALTIRLPEKRPGPVSHADSCMCMYSKWC